MGQAGAELLGSTGLKLYTSTKLRDGDDISVSLSTDDLKAISKYLNDLLPHATFGYTKDREQWFMASPLMLLREEGER
jgi:hypothetical protein